MGSWVAVEPSGTRLPSRLGPARLGARLQLLSRALGSLLASGAYKSCYAIKRHKLTQKAIIKCFCPKILGRKPNTSTRIPVVLVIPGDLGISEI